MKDDGRQKADGEMRGNSFEPNGTDIFVKLVGLKTIEFYKP